MIGISFGIQELLKENHFDLIYDDTLRYGKESRFDANYGHIAIFIKEGLCSLREDFLILHELGHYFIHYRTEMMQFALQLRNLRS